MARRRLPLVSRHVARDEAHQVLQRKRAQSVPRREQPRLVVRGLHDDHAVQQWCVRDDRRCAPVAFARAAHGAQEALHVDVNGRVIDGRAEKDPLRVHLQAVVQASIGQGLERVERLPEALSARGLGQVGPEQINQGAAWMAATRLEH
jgi:hypothetical protein